MISGLSRTERSERRKGGTGMSGRACVHGCSLSRNSVLLLTMSGLFQADNKGETGVMGFPGPRVSTDTFRQFSPLSWSWCLLTGAVLKCFRGCLVQMGVLD